MIVSKKKKLKQIIEQAQKQNKKVLIKKGVFDIIHPGHIYSIRQFKKYADIVIIFVQSGFLTKKEKGEKKPINSSKQRAEVINGVKNVDYVYIDKSKSMEECLSILEYLRPDIIAVVKKRKTKKYDRPYWELKEFPDKNKQIFSTSNIINKIINKIS
ncbi:adenylyltransferase/cytidyltransferase family protein [Patescibacteria group bacterium]|nr:adenylyltransferase/cytidyltransferase family protein [Patescibacteria group bacterium]